MKTFLLASADRLAAVIRRALPPTVLPLVVCFRSAFAWALPGVRADARSQMSFLLGCSRPDADVEQAARAYVRRQIWRAELRWHPELITHQRVQGLSHLRAASESGRGVVLNFSHHGSYEGALASVGRLGFPAYAMVLPRTLEPHAPRWVQQHLRVARSGGCQIVSTAIGSAGIAALLRARKIVAIASDVPGSTPVRFAGRDVLGSFGAARLAQETDALIVLLTSESDAEGSFVRLHAPLDPRTFPDARALLKHMVEQHEGPILARPSRYDVPLSRWRTEVNA